MRFRVALVGLPAVLCLLASSRLPAQRQFEDVPGRLPVNMHDSHGLAVVDVDGDGDLDIVIGNYGVRTSLYLNDGTGTFDDASATHMPRVALDYTLDLAMGDVDGDGDLDLVLANGGVCPSGCPLFNELFLNDGTGRFFDATSRMPVDGDLTESVVLGDVDGDDDLDIIFGNRSFFGTMITRNSDIIVGL